MAVDDVKRHLAEFGLDGRVREFDTSSATVELAAQAVGTEPRRIAKTLSFLVGDSCILIVAAGDARVDNKKYKERFGVKAKMLAHDDVPEYIGHAVGGVCPFAVKDGVKVYCFTRVRNVDNEPLILETSYYPQHIYPNLTREMLETHSFYSLLYHVGVVPFAAEDSYEAVTLGEYEAKLLGCVPGAAAFHHQRRTTMENGLVYECTSRYMRGDRVRLDVCFQKSGTSFTRVVG